MSAQLAENQVTVMKPLSRKEQRRNYGLSITDGAIFALAYGMVPLNTVIIYFMSGFVSQKWLLGMLSFLHILLSSSPQIIAARKLERLRTYKPYLLAAALLMRLFWLLLGLNVILFADKNPMLFVILFYFFYSMIGLISSFNNITWLNLMVKIIPADFRGRFLGIRATIGGIFEASGAVLMGFIIKRLAYPYNYGVLFITVFVLTMISLVFVFFIKENEAVKEVRQESLKQYFSKAMNVIKQDGNFRNYLITVALVGALGKMALAFQVVFAKEKLGITPQQLSAATFVLLSSQSFGYLIWGMMGDKYGFKLTLELSAVIFLPAIFLTYLMSNLIIFYIAIGLFGLAQSARNVNENNLAINLCRNEENQPLYIGTRNLLSGPFFAAYPVIAGVIYDNLGQTALFIASPLCTIIGLYIMLRHVKEYR